MPLQRNKERTRGKTEASRRTGSSGIARIPGRPTVVFARPSPTSTAHSLSSPYFDSGQA